MVLLSWCYKFKIIIYAYSLLVSPCLQFHFCCRFQSSFISFFFSIWPFYFHSTQTFSTVVCNLKFTDCFESLGLLLSLRGMGEKFNKATKYQDKSVCYLHMKSFSYFSVNIQLCAKLSSETETNPSKLLWRSGFNIHPKKYFLFITCVENYESVCKTSSCMNPTLHS